MSLVLGFAKVTMVRVVAPDRPHIYTCVPVVDTCKIFFSGLKWPILPLCLCAIDLFGPWFDRYQPVVDEITDTRPELHNVSARPQLE